MSIRETPEYERMRADHFTATMIAEGVEEADEATTLAAWQALHDSGLAYRLQGFFGRTARGLIDAGMIEE